MDRLDTWTIACQIMRQTSEYLLSKFSITITRVSASTIIEIYNATISVEIIKNSRLFIARLDMQLRNRYPIGLREMLKSLSYSRPKELRGKNRALFAHSRKLIYVRRNVPSINFPTFYEIPTEVSKFYLQTRDIVARPRREARERRNREAKRRLFLSILDSLDFEDRR